MKLEFNKQIDCPKCGSETFDGAYCTWCKFKTTAKSRKKVFDKVKADFEAQSTYKGR